MTMTSARATAWVVGAVLVAVSVAASAGACFHRAGAVASAAVSPAQAPPRHAASVVADSGRSAAAVTPRRRNLFRMADRAVPAAPPAWRPAEAVPRPAADLVPAGPVVTLVGIAERVVEGRTIRTAVVSGAGELWLVQEGAVVAGRYRVERIGADTVQLQDSVDGSAWTLRLQQP